MKNGGKALSGVVFGRLTVVERDAASGGRRTYSWVCLCNCGRRVIVRQDKLISGHTKSCGCLSRERVSTHGGSSTNLYTRWRGMKSRCLNPNHKHYKDYGGRGISICNEWKNDFAAFEKWALANGYRKDLSIDRIDNDKGYSPDNCRWATWHEQRTNQRHPQKKRLGATNTETQEPLKPYSNFTTSGAALSNGRSKLI